MKRMAVSWERSIGRARQKALWVLVAAVAAGVLWVGQAISQQQDPPPRGERRQRDPARMEEFRKRAAERMRENLGASEEEMKVLQPRIEKVQTLARQSRGGMRGMMGGGRRGNRPGGEGATARPEREQTEIEKATGALSKLVADKESKPEAIKTSLATLRQAREKAKQELAKAQKELREVVTVRQEAQLVLMGLLD